MPIASNVTLGPDVVIFQPDLVNLYGCTVGAETRMRHLSKFRRTPPLARAAKSRLTHLFVKAWLLKTKYLSAMALCFVAGVPAKVIGDVRDRQNQNVT